jgi:hypothetical protein
MSTTSCRGGDESRAVCIDAEALASIGPSHARLRPRYRGGMLQDPSILRVLLTNLDVGRSRRTSEIECGLSAFWKIPPDPTTGAVRVRKKLCRRALSAMATLPEGRPKHALSAMDPPQEPSSRPPAMSLRHRRMSFREHTFTAGHAQDVHGQILHTPYAHGEWRGWSPPPVVMAQLLPSLLSSTARARRLKVLPHLREAS